MKKQAEASGGDQIVIGFDFKVATNPRYSDGPHFSQVETLCEKWRAAQGRQKIKLLGDIEVLVIKMSWWKGYTEQVKAHIKAQVQYAKKKRIIVACIQDGVITTIEQNHIPKLRDEAIEDPSMLKIKLVPVEIHYFDTVQKLLQTARINEGTIARFDAVHPIKRVQATPVLSLETDCAELNIAEV